MVSGIGRASDVELVGPYSASWRPARRLLAEVCLAHGLSGFGPMARFFFFLFLLFLFFCASFCVAPSHPVLSFSAV